MEEAGQPARHDFTIMLAGLNGKHQVIKAEDAKKLADAVRKKIIAENKITQAETNTSGNKTASGNTDARTARLP